MQEKAEQGGCNPADRYIRTVTGSEATWDKLRESINNRWKLPDEHFFKDPRDEATRRRLENEDYLASASAPWEDDYGYMAGPSWEDSDNWSYSAGDPSEDDDDEDDDEEDDEDEDENHEEDHEEDDGEAGDHSDAGDAHSGRSPPSLDKTILALTNLQLDRDSITPSAALQRLHYVLKTTEAESQWAYDHARHLFGVAKCDWPEHVREMELKLQFLVNEIKGYVLQWKNLQS
jgi:hypothetical protein